MQSPEIEQPLDAEQEYRAIEQALLETTRGRWFLAEHSRRSRRMESGQLEDALAKLKSSMRDPPALLGRLRSELDQISALIAATRTELLERAPASNVTAAGSPTTTGGLLKAAEDLHELIWSLQARDIDPVVCEQIGRQTATIFALTARQAHESKRALKFIEALDAVAHRVSAVLETIMHETAPPETGTLTTPLKPRLVVG